MIDLGTLIDYGAYGAWLAVFGGLILSAIYIALGKEEGKKLLIGSVIAAFILAFGWIILSSSISYQSYNIPGWSDIAYIIYAAAATAVIASAIMFLRGDSREALGYLVTAAILLWAINYGPAVLGVNNLNLNAQPPSVDFGGISVAGFSFGGVPVSWLVDLPDPNTLPGFQSMYTTAQNISLAVLGIAAAGALIYYIFETEDAFEALKRTSKDLIVAVLFIYAIPDIYSLFAQIINYMSNSLVNPQPIQNAIANMDNVEAAIIAGGFAGGYFVPALADIASDLLFSLFIAAALAAIRFFVIAAAILLAPLFTALWMFPPIRGAAKFLMEIILGLGFAGLIAAGMLYLLANILNKFPVLYLASPVLFGFFPMMLGFGGATSLISGGTNLIPFRRPKSQSGGQSTVAGSTTAQTQLKSIQRTTTPQGTSVTILRKPSAAPTGIVGRIRNREQQVQIQSGIAPVPQQSFLDKLKYKTDREILPPPNAMQKAPSGNLRLDMNQVRGISQIGGNITPARSDIWSKVTKQERIPYAIVSGVAANVKEGVKMTLDKTIDKIDAFLKAHGLNFRMREAKEYIIKNIKLKKPKITQ
ncbi:hypothetical protein AAGT10_14765 (plasmid) [Sulfolobus tengchongensis]